MRYHVELALPRLNGRSTGRLAALALSASIYALGACGSGGGFPDAHKLEPAPDPGTFSLKWSITDGSGGSAETCTQAMATEVAVTATNESTSDESSTQFDCTLGEAVSGALFIGTYDLTFALVGSAGTALATAPKQTGIVISSDNTTAVAPVTFAVSM